MMVKIEFIESLPAPKTRTKNSVTRSPLNGLTAGEWLKHCISFQKFSSSPSDELWEIKKQHAGTFPQSLAKHYIEFFTNRGDSVLDMFSGCYDIHTEVLTKEGWKFFKDIDRNDEFFTRSPSGLLEYHHSTAVQRHHHMGDMIRIKARAIDLLVTPDHNMYVKTHADYQAGRQAQFIKAENLAHILYRIPTGGIYHPPLKDLDPHVMFLCGIYLADGHLTESRNKTIGNAVILSMEKERKRSEVYRRLKEFYSISEINNGRKLRVKVGRELTSFIEKHCGRRARTKYLSPYLLSNGHLSDLFDGMMLGDGHYDKHGSASYSTSSKRLADGFQELCLKLGNDTTMHTRLRSPHQLNGRTIKPNGPSHEITVRKSAHKSIHKWHISTEEYDDEVFCVTVPNHTLFVRRNGKTAWCGNSGTTAISACRIGRVPTGIELYEKWIDITHEIIEKKYYVEAQVGLEQYVDLDAPPDVDFSPLRILRGDAVKTMRTLKDGSFDYSLFSPPYADAFSRSSGGVLTRQKQRLADGLDTDYGDDKRDIGNHGVPEWKRYMRRVFKELTRLIKPHGYVTVVLQNLVTVEGIIPLAGYLQDIVMALPEWTFRMDQIWIQPNKAGRINGWPSRPMPSNHHTYLLSFQRGEE